ncbi:hypothetical protein KCTC52924_03430 [Arenibacter antarcticus]|uniref:BACON domain-containing protein n=1 Tax=Arenibacter antarcticus TaxID=2040469 RepID=A0ABW5VEH2_9FLAO|nr:BACON domain-containing protein [Arenibacter sp. H213]MCM4166497.1 hypothetical protein [Arenibacter sp. H213]
MAQKNTKNPWKFIYLPFILLGLMYGCDIDLERTFSDNITPHRSEIIVPAEIEGSVSLGFTTSIDWEATSDVNWITIEDKFKTGKQGGNNIDILIEPNKTEEKREGKITISSLNGELSRTITIIQEAEPEDVSTIQTLFHVKENGDGSGRSWKRAINLQSALDLAIAGDTIYLAEGFYKPSKTITNGDSNDDRNKTFEISKNITIVGGFPSDAIKTSESDPSNYKTILSGKLAEGVNAYHTVVVSAPLVPGEEVNISALTIRDGASANKGKVDINNSSYDSWYGGGINIANAIVNLTDVTITENNNVGNDESSRAGGVMIKDDSRVTFNNCFITKNSVSSNHGGMRIDDSTVYMYNSEISYNSSNTSAGVYATGSSTELHLYNSVVKENMSAEYGGGLYIAWGSVAYIVNSLIINNINNHEGTKGGGALMLYKDNSTAYVISSTITGNKATYGGGVLGLSGDVYLNVYNSIISGNHSQEGDTEVYKASGSLINSSKSSVVDGKFYDSARVENPGAINIADILNSELLPIGSPVTDKGMSGSDLTSDTGMPTLSNDEYLSIDYHSNSRTQAIMGAIVGEK